MFTIFTKVLAKKDSLQKALLLLEKSSNQGNVQAQQMLNFYKALQVKLFSPLSEHTMSLNSDKEKINALVQKCLKDKRPSKKKRPAKKAARNPNNNK